jgi:ligand-binding sensor domain-containing protein
MNSKGFSILLAIAVIFMAFAFTASADTWLNHQNTNHADFVLVNDEEIWVKPDSSVLVRWDVASGTYMKYGAGDAGLVNSPMQLAYDDNAKLIVYDGRNIYRYENKYFNLITTVPDSNFYQMYYADGSILITSEAEKKVLKFNGESWTEIPELSGYQVYNIWSDPRGGFWIHKYRVTIDGSALLYYKNGIQKEFTLKDITNSDLDYIGFYQIYVDSKGIVWASLKDGVAWYDGEKWQQYYLDDINSLVLYDVFNSVEDKDGNIWFSASVNGLVKYDGEAFTKVPEYENTKVLWVDKAPMGGVWVGTEESLEHFDGTTRTPYVIKNQLPISNQTTAVTIDSEGDLWCGDYYGDLATLHLNTWKHFRGRTISETGSGNVGQLNDLLPSKATGIWAAFTLDLFNYKDGTWISYKDDLEPQIGVGFYDIAEAPNGDIWVAANGGNTGGLARWNGSSWEFHKPKYMSGIPQGNHVMCFDKEGNLWVVTSGSLYTYDGIGWKIALRIDDEQFPKDFQGNSLTTMKDGSIWVGSKNTPNIVVIQNGEIVKIFSEKDGLPFTDDQTYNDGINGIKQAPDGTIWINSNNGLLNYDGSQFKRYTEYGFEDFALNPTGRLFFPGGGITEFTPTSVTLRMNLLATGLIYKAGDKLSLSLNVNNYGPDETGDLYFVMIAPDGKIYSGLDWSESFHPAAANLTIPEGFSMPLIQALKVTLPSVSPPISMPGKYYFALALADTGTTYFRAKVITSMDVVK